MPILNTYTPHINDSDEDQSIMAAEAEKEIQNIRCRGMDGLKELLKMGFSAKEPNIPKNLLFLTIFHH